MVPLLDQFYYFALTILIGMVAGFCYDLYKVTRGTLRLRKMGTAFGDVLFWFVLTVVVFVLLLLGNWGEVRLYVFLGLIVGAVIYINFFSKGTTSIIKWVFSTLNKTWKLLIKFVVLTWGVICLPFKGAYLAVAIPFGFTAGILSKTYRGTKMLVNNILGRPVRKIKRSFKNRISSIFPIFEYKDRE